MRHGGKARVGSSSALGAATIRPMPEEPVDRLRAICLALPEAAEEEAWGDPTWRVQDPVFAMVEQGDGRVSLWC